MIEPLSQSDRANFQLSPLRLTGTQARVNLFARPDIRLGEGGVMSTKLTRSVVPTVDVSRIAKAK